MQAVSIIVGMILTSIFLFSGLLALLKKTQAEPIRERYGISSTAFTVSGGIAIFAALGVLASTFFSGIVDWLGFLGAMILIFLTLGFLYYEIKTENNTKKILIFLASTLLCIVFLVSVAKR